jgi:predicted transcriptional regulator
MIRGKTRHQLFLPNEMSKRLSAMAKSQNRSRSDLLVEMVDAYMNKRAAPPVDERVLAKLDRIAHAVERGNDECLVISQSLYRFIRHQLIYAAALPAPGEETIALGKKQFQRFLDSVARMMAKGTENDAVPSQKSDSI